MRAAAVGLLVLCTPLAAVAQEATPVSPTQVESVPAEIPATTEPSATQSAPSQPGETQPAEPAVTPPVEPSATQDAEPTGAQPPSTGEAVVAPDQPAPAEQAVPEEGGAAEAPNSVPATEGTPMEMPMIEERRSDLPHDLSPWGMFMAADLVVKAVMIGLAFASLVTWTVWLAKSLEIAGARARARRALAAVTSSATLNEALQKLEPRRGPGAWMVRSAAEEMSQSNDALDHAGNEGVKERVASRLSRIEAHAGRRLAKGTGVLATIGSTAPFVGLFGTVWGIMNSFIGISEAQTTNLAVVAPGIAEALLATAIGLVAAIPAVIFYNVFARAIGGYRQLLADVAAGVERLISRDLDFRRVPAAVRGDASQALAAE